MRKKHKKVYRVLNYIEHLLAVVSTVRKWISISGFAILVSISVGITISAIGLKICVITAGFKKFKSIIKKKKKKHDKVISLAKSKLNSVQVLIHKS